jgi:ABC-type amino acid transport substrate-binding protein
LVGADGEAAGLGVDTLRAAAARAGLAVEIGVGPWAQIKAALIAGELDVLPLVARTPEREPLMDFTRPYLILNGAVVVRSGAPAVLGVEDLRGREVALLAGGAADEYARRNAVTDRLVPMASNAQALRALAFGDVDAVLIWRSVGRRLIAELGLSNLRIADLSMDGFSQAFCLAVTEGDEALRRRLDDALAQILADGTFDQIRDRWMRADGVRLPEPGFTTRYGLFVLLVMVAAGLALYWRWRTGRRSAGDAP